MSALQMRSARDDLVSSKAVVSFESPRAGDGPPLALAPAPLPQFVGDARTFQTLFALPLAGGGATLAVHRAGSTLVVDGADAAAAAAALDAREEPSSRRRRVREALSRAARLEDGGFRDALRAEDAGVEEAKAEPPRLLDAAAAEFEPGGASPSTRAALRAIVAAAADSQKSLGARRSEEAARAVEALADAALCPAYGDFDAAPAGLLAARPWADYARVRRWRVGAADVLSGSDALVDRRFDADTAVRLIRAEDVGEPGSRRRAVLDGWLENVIAGVPKLALCLERFGVVVGAKVLDTAEIPKAFADADGGDHALFDAKSVEVHAAAVLRFLADHCDRDGATYVLAKDASDERLRLYDLDALADAKKKQWKWLLATLSARFAHRVRAHLRLGADGGADGDLDAATRSSLLDRLRGLATTALDLLAEIEDSEGEPHLAMRASLEEMKAASFLDGAKSWRGSQRAADHPWTAPKVFGAEPAGAAAPAPFEALRACASADLESARDRFEAALAFALRLASEKKSEFGKAAISRRVEDLSAAAVDCAVALAAAHLERVQPSNLMHELRRAATGLRGGGESAGRDARSAAVWHLAAAFARGVDKRRFEWSEKGAHAPDCVALLKDLDDVFHPRRASSPETSPDARRRAPTFEGSDLGGAAPGCFHAPDALALAAGLAAAAAADAALVKPRFSRDAADLRAAAKAPPPSPSAAAPPLLHLACCRALALARAAAAARRLGGAEPAVLAKRLGDACNDVGAAASKAGHEAGDGVLGARARAWLAVALARVAGDEAAEASVRLNVAVHEKRRFAADGDERHLEAAAFHCGGALDALGDAGGGLRRAACAELAATRLFLGTARRRRLFADGGGESNQNTEKLRRDEDAVLAPLRAAVAAAEDLDPAAAGPHRYQLGSFLAARAASAAAPKGRPDEALAHLAAAAARFEHERRTAPVSRARDAARGRALAALDAAALLRSAAFPDPASKLRALRELLCAEDALDDADAPDLAARVRAALPPAARDLVAAVSGGGDDDLAAAARGRCKAAYLALMKGDAAAARRELAPLWDAG